MTKAWDGDGREASRLKDGADTVRRGGSTTLDLGQPPLEISCCAATADQFEAAEAGALAASEWGTVTSCFSPPISMSPPLLKMKSASAAKTTKPTKIFHMMVIR